MNNSSDKLNPMFNRMKQRRLLTPKPNETTMKRERKERNDKKIDIKIPLNEKQMIVFRKLAYQRKMSPTSFASYLVIKGMDYDLEFEEVDYYNHPDTVHAKLSLEQHGRLFEYDLQWNNRSMRKTAHRILIGMLNFLNGEVNNK